MINNAADINIHRYSFAFEFEKVKPVVAHGVSLWYNLHVSGFPALLFYRIERISRARHTTHKDEVITITTRELAALAYDRLDLPDEAREKIDSYIRLILGDAEAFAACRRAAALAFGSGDNAGSEISAISARTGLGKLEVQLALVILYMPESAARYRERGIDDGIYIQSMTDLAIWAKSTFKNLNVWGNTEYSWNLTGLRGDIVRLGRLQFHQIKYRHEDVTVGSLTVKNGDTVINIHVPEDGPLPAAECFDAYRRAYRYFDCGGEAAFVCDSWLLWPGHEDILPETSNILRFKRDFRIVSSDESTGNLWRVFGRKADFSKPEALPRETGLQRAYADALCRSVTPGTGYGIFAYDGEGEETRR